MRTNKCPSCRSKMVKNTIINGVYSDYTCSNTECRYHGIDADDELENLSLERGVYDWEPGSDDEE